MSFIPSSPCAVEYSLLLVLSFSGYNNIVFISGRCLQSEIRLTR